MIDIFVRDCGLVHHLLGITNQKSLLEHPKNGATWEGYAIEEILKCIDHDEAYFWATHSGAELDLLLIRNQRKFGFELKRQDAPGMTKSIHIAIEDLGLERLCVLYPGSKHYPLSDRVIAAPIATLGTDAATRILIGEE